MIASKGGRRTTTKTTETTRKRRKKKKKTTTTADLVLMSPGNGFTHVPILGVFEEVRDGPKLFLFADLRQ